MNPPKYSTFVGTQATSQLLAGLLKFAPVRISVAVDPSAPHLKMQAIQTVNGALDRFL